VLRALQGSSTVGQYNTVVGSIRAAALIELYYSVVRPVLRDGTVQHVRGLFWACQAQEPSNRAGHGQQC